LRVSGAITTTTKKAPNFELRGTLRLTFICNGKLKEKPLCPYTVLLYCIPCSRHTSSFCYPASLKPTLRPPLQPEDFSTFLPGNGFLELGVLIVHIVLFRFAEGKFVVQILDRIFLLGFASTQVSY